MHREGLHHVGKERRVRPALGGLRWWRCIEEVWSSWTDSLGLMVAPAAVFSEHFLMLLRHAGGGAAANKTNRVCFGENIFDTNILLLFYKIK